MASHVDLGGSAPSVQPPANISAPAPSLNLKGFHWTTVDKKLHPQEIREQSHLKARVPEAHSVQVADLQKPQEALLVAQTFAPSFRAAAQATPLISTLQRVTAIKPPLPAPLTQLQGAFAGNGFNTIFRPRSKKDDVFRDETLKSMDFADTIRIGQTVPPDNILELNFTLEQLTFNESIGDIPNRGLDSQEDIKNISGFPYLQTVQDVTNLDTGKGDNPQADGIHFEPGMFLFVPANPSTPNNDNAPTIVRMASIPHGTTINAQGIATDKTTPGPPDFDSQDNKLDITPFVIPDVTKKNEKTTFIGFPSMKVDKPNTLRLPQDLSLFKKAGSITDEIIKNPNAVLKNAISGLKIIEHVTFEVSTGGPKAKVAAGGAANIAFLQGPTSSPPSGNAHAVSMTYRMWIETVEYEVPVPKLTKKDSPVTLKPNMPPGSTAPTPTFLIMPPSNLPSPAQKIKLRGIQLQYSQTVNLNFGGLTWPHVSVATLVPKEPLPFTLTS